MPDIYFWPLHMFQQVCGRTLTHNLIIMRRRRRIKIEKKTPLAHMVNVSFKFDNICKLLYYLR